MTATKNIKYIDFSKCHFSIWRGKNFHLKYSNIKTRFYRKHSIFLGKYIFEIGWLRYEKGNRRYI